MGFHDGPGIGGSVTYIYAHYGSRASKNGRERFSREDETQWKAVSKAQADIGGDAEIISERGIERCIGRSNFIRMIAPDLGLAEVKVSGKVIRIQAQFTFRKRAESETDWMDGLLYPCCLLLFRKVAFAVCRP